MRPPRGFLGKANVELQVRVRVEDADAKTGLWFCICWRYHHVMFHFKLPLLVLSSLEIG